MESKKKLIVFTISLGMFLWSFSAGIVNISLPTLSQFLDISTNEVSLIIIVHLLVLTSFLLIFGRIGDIVGQKKVFVVGISIFTVSSYLCAISLDIYQLLLFRIIQGVGSAMLISMVPSIITTVFSDTERGRIFGYISLTTTLGLAFGYGIGGFILEYFSWNWIFLSVVPLGIVTSIMAFLVLPSYKNSISHIGFDLVGSVLIFLATLTFILPFNIERIFNASLNIMIITMLISVLLIIAFFKWESYYKDPLFDVSVLKNISISLSVTAAFFVTLVITGTTFLLPFFLELVMGYSSDFTGLIILIPALAMIFVGPLSGHISDKIGSRIPILIACTTLIIAVTLLYVLNNTIGLAFIFIALAIRSLSEGMFTPANNKLVMSHSTEEKISSVSSLLNTSRYMGLMMGVVFFNAIFDYIVNTKVSELTGLPTEGAFQLSAPTAILLQGFQAAFVVGIIISILVLLFSFFSQENRIEDPS